MAAPVQEAKLLPEHYAPADLTIQNEKPCDEFYNQKISLIDRDVVIDESLDELEEKEIEDIESRKDLLVLNLGNYLGRRLYRRIVETRGLCVSYTCLTPTEWRILYGPGSTEEFRRRVLFATNEWLNDVVIASCPHRGFMFGVYDHNSSMEPPPSSFPFHVHDMHALKSLVLSACPSCESAGHVIVASAASA